MAEGCGPVAGAGATAGAGGLGAGLRLRPGRLGGCSCCRGCSAGGDVERSPSEGAGEADRPPRLPLLALLTLPSAAICTPSSHFSTLTHTKSYLGESFSYFARFTCKWSTKKFLIFHKTNLL